MRSSNVLKVMLLALALTGCGGGGSPPPPPVSIAVTPQNPSIPNGAVLQFTATGTFSDNSTQNLTGVVNWTSSTLGVATINAAGLATAVGIGTTTITASSGVITSAPVTLTVTPAALSSIVVTPANPSIGAGGNVQFAATGTFTDGTTQNLTTAVTWSSLSSFIATISNAAGSNGLASGVNAGSTTIRAASGAISGVTTLTVTGGGAAANLLPVTVNGALCSAGSYLNKPCVSVTICTPGTSTCQTISDILLDTGSYGLRVFNQVVTVPLNQVTVPAGNLAECVRFGDGSALWGPVQTADVVLGGEPAVSVPIQVVNAAFPVSGAVPASCGIPDATPAIAGFNGILGVGLFVESCGTGCSTLTNNGVYFACTGTACSNSTAPLASQVQNPVAHLPLDNNGVLVQIPAIPAGGAPSVNGQILLGIGTRTNNVPAGVTAFPASPLTGNFSTVFNGVTLSSSFIDSGSNGLFFPAPATLLPTCAAPNAVWYCPSATQNLSATNRGATGAPSGIVDFQIGNALGLFSSGNNAFAELGGALPPLLSGFDWGLPFFYGRSVFVGIEGRNAAGLGAGPYWAY